MLEGGGVGPFSERRLDEAFGLAVGLWCIWLGHDVLDTQATAGTCKGLRAIATTVVGHHAINGDAEALKIGDCLEERGDRALLFLVREYRGGGHARMVVDRHMDELEADSSGRVWLPLIAGDAMPYR